MRRGEQATKSEPLPRHRHPTCRKWCNRAQRGSMDELIQNLSYSVRQMARKPRFAAVLMLTLALGVGANTAVFSVVHNVLLPWRGSDGTSNSTKWVCVVDHCGCGRWCASGRSGHRAARSPVPGACAESCHVVSRAEYDCAIAHRCGATGPRLVGASGRGVWRIPTCRSTRLRRWSTTWRARPPQSAFRCSCSSFLPVQRSH